MERQRRRDTAPEITVRRKLHALGVRFRVDVPPEPDLRIRGDLVWRGRKVVVFIDGCFWHACPQHATWPKTNASWWRTKIRANVERDRRADQTLRERGWTVLRFWEHEETDLIVSTILAELERGTDATRPLPARLRPP